MRLTIMCLILLANSAFAATVILDRENYVASVAETLQLVGSAILCGNTGIGSHSGNNLGYINTNLAIVRKHVKKNLKITNIKLDTTGGNEESQICVVIE